MSMTTKLHMEIDEKFDELAKLDPTSKEYSAAVDSITKLMDRAIEIEKLEVSEAHNENQMKEDRRSRIAKNCIDIGLPVASLGITAWLALTSLKFEEEGSITTTIGRKTLDLIFKNKR